MTQAPQFFTYNAANIAASDLAIIDTCLDALFSNNSGPGAPSGWGSIPGMTWFDTLLPAVSGGLLKHVNSTGSGWYGIFSGSSSFKIWVYLNVLTTEEGWVRDSTVTDVVTALKSTSGVYATGGAVAPTSSWEISGINSNAHNHKWYDYEAVAGVIWSMGGFALRASSWQSDGSTKLGLTASTDAWTEDDSHTHTQDGSWRIRAAVGIMVYPDM